MNDLVRHSIECCASAPEYVSRLVQQHTTSLLGTTIGYSEDDWATPSALPGWSRAHVASHLAVGANAMLDLIDDARFNTRESVHPSGASLADQREAGAAKDSLSLQIFLDTSAGALGRAFHDLDDASWSQPITIGERRAALECLPSARLYEIIVHRVDMLDGYTFSSLERDSALIALGWRASRLIGRQDVPAVRLMSENGFDVTIGRDCAPALVKADPQTLLGWTSFRLTDDLPRAWPRLPLPIPSIPNPSNPSR